MLLPLVKASLVIMVLLGFYKLFLERESFFKANRVYLTACLVLACALPFIALPKLTQHQGFVTSIIEVQAPKTIGDRESPVTQKGELTLEQEGIVEDLKDDSELGGTPNQFESKPGIPEKAVVEDVSPVQKKELERTKEIQSVENTKSVSNQPVSTPPALGWLTEKDPVFWLTVIYVFGVAIMSMKLLGQVLSILRSVLRNSDKIEDEDGTIVNVYADIAPCSFFKFIFINPTIYDYETYEQIITHEKIHVRKHHSIDLLLAELVGILLWFNPFVWVLRKEIEKNIEYQTDDILVNGSSDVRENYQMNLVKIASTNKPLAITTNYNQSLIKQRILKMNNRKSNNHSYWKYAFVAPLIFVLLIFLNKPNIGYAKNDNSSKGNSESVLSTVPIETNNPDELNDVAERSTERLSPFANSCHALTQATRDQDIDEITKQLKKVDPNCVDPDPGYLEEASDDGRYTWRRSHPRTPLATAARFGNLAIGKLLVEAGAKVDFDRGDHGSPITEAAGYGHLDFVKFLVGEGVDLNYMTDGQGSSLHCAARNGHLEVVKYLLDEGVPLNRQNDGQGTPLNGAARNGHVGTVAFLIDKGADINMQNDGQGSALNAAARNGHVEVAALLISKGANINDQRDGQGSALNAAARNGHTEMINLLLDKGADVNRQNDGQGSALNAAARNGHIKAVELLLSRGADIDRHNDGQGSALNAAARNGHTGMIKLLVSKGASIDKQTDGQGSALNAAARNGHISTVELLLSLGADIDRQNNGQGSALNAAARNGHLDVVKLLVEKGADVNLHIDGQGTALSAASRNRHRRVVEFLQENGAR